MKRKVLAHLSEEDSAAIERINANVATFITLMSNANFSSDEMMEIQKMYEVLKEKRRRSVVEIIRKYKLPMVDENILHFSSNRNEVYIDIT